ncbi:MAG TPA: glycine oxidase ThiO [Terriglobales bacterium]|nr:glycine oxidase ThiO [Terriglobales bacterium]
MKSWDAVVIGAGVIGLSVALELNKRGFKVLLLERSEPGREASHAAGGMLAHCDPHNHPKLQPLANASAQMYPEFVLELEDETGVHIDFRRQGTISFHGNQDPICGHRMSAQEVAGKEPRLVPPGHAYFLPEACLDPRRLVEALSKSLHRRNVDIATGTHAVAVETEARKVTSVKTEKSTYPTRVAINCAGAWASNLPPGSLRTLPVKGQMLSIVPRHGTHFPLRHVVRSEGCYLIPRSDGRIVIGATVEDAGFDKHVDSHVIQSLHQAAAVLMPELGEGRILEAWSGIRPGSPDHLPMIGETSYLGYLAATGHFRDGILLAPVTARIIGELVAGQTPEMNLIPFAPERFS